MFVCCSRFGSFAAGFVGGTMLCRFASCADKVFAKGADGKITARLAYGTPANRIGTFDGWTFWLGWDGSFSETYDPFSETYAWVVYFAPEGVFVALQWAENQIIPTLTCTQPTITFTVC